MKDPNSNGARVANVARRRRKQFVQSDPDSRGEFFSSPPVITASRATTTKAAIAAP